MCCEGKIDELNTFNIVLGAGSFAFLPIIGPMVFAGFKYFANDDEEKDKTTAKLQRALMEFAVGYIAVAVIFSIY